jgi:two-component sensor histidine kinase
MISELVTNGMRYGAKDRNAAIFIDLRVEGTIRCVVSGTSLGFMLDGQAGEAGRWGLRVLDWLAERWGVSQVDDETRIWFELARE